MELPPSRESKQDEAYPANQCADGFGNAPLGDAVGASGPGLTTGPLATLEEIWEIRRKIASELGDDIEKKVAYYRGMDKRPGVRLFRRSEREKE